MTFRATKVPNNELALTNRISAHPSSLQQHSHIQISTDAGVFVFTVEATTATNQGDLGFSELQRKWAMLEMNNQYRVSPYRFDHSQYLATITLEVSFYISTKTTQEPYDTAQMAQIFLQNLAAGGQAFSIGQPLIFTFKSKPVLRLTVKDMVAVDLEAMQRNVQGQKKKPKDNVGLSQPNMQILFEKGGTSPVVLVGEALASIPQRSVINPEFDFGKLGIGGLDKEFSGIFRRAFASRVFPANIAMQLGLKHVRGILLFGPPGTGKTLMARQIGKMLNTREPKIVSGPQVLDKYVGESEANIRKLFAEAEEEQKKLGLHSGLHIIIFDEIDAICKARGSVAGAAGVHDSMVNQLLAKMDGVDQLDNVLVIGMTNRRDMIDEALLRPGRFEVQMEIGLPDEHGRVQILTIHTAKMRDANRLAPDVDLKHLAKNTKNFSGAELEGLVRAATSLAMYRCIKATSKVEVDEVAMQNLRVDAADFENALENDVKPAFGAAEERLESMSRNGIIMWGQPVVDVLETGAVLCEQAKTSSLVSVLLRGPPNSGKTALAARICMQSEFPFIKVCSPDDTLGYSESSKVLAIKKLFDDAYRSKLSCILVDDIERLIEYGAIGPRYSNACLHVLLVLLKKEPPKDRHLLIVGTTSCPDVMRALGISSAFKNELHVDQLTRSEQLIDAIRKVEIFDERELSNIAQQLNGQRLRIGIKKLLALTEMVKKVEPRERVMRFMQRLHEDGISPVGYGEDNNIISGGVGEIMDNMMMNHK